MKFIGLAILSFILQSSSGGGEVGGNGDGISAFFVRAAYVLQAKMEKKENEGTVFLNEFKAETFKSLLNTVTEVIGKDQEELLRGRDGRLKDVKVIFDATGHPHILLRAEVWDRYLSQLRPDYRMVLHAYLYAAKLDDSMYQYSSLVPLESMGLAETLSDDGVFHEFATPYPLKKLKKIKAGYLGISFDGTKIATFNERGLLKWQYRLIDAYAVDVDSDSDSSFSIFARHGDKVEILRVDMAGHVLMTKSYDEAHTPLAVYERTYLTDKTIFLHDAGSPHENPRILWTADEGVVIRGGISGFFYVYGYKQVGDKRFPFFAKPGSFSNIFEDIEGEFSAATYTRANNIRLGGKTKDGRPFLVDALIGERFSGAVPFSKAQFLNYPGATVKSFARTGKIDSIAVSDGRSSALFSYDEYGKIRLSQLFSDEVLQDVVEADESGHIVIGSSKKLFKSYALRGRSWTTSFTMENGEESCERFWPEKMQQSMDLCKAERGVFNTLCYAKPRRAEKPPFVERMVRCDQTDTQPVMIDYAMLGGTWWSSFATIHRKDKYGESGSLASSQFEFIVTGDKISIDGGICLNTQGCPASSDYEPYSKVEGTIKNNRVWLTCGGNPYEAGGIESNTLTLKLPVTAQCDRMFTLTIKPGVRPDLLSVEASRYDNYWGKLTGLAIIEKDLKPFVSIVNGK